MVDDGVGSFSDLVDDEVYQFIKDDVQLDPTLMISEEEQNNSNNENMNPLMMHILVPGDNTTINMEEFKYLNSYGQNTLLCQPPEQPKEVSNREYPGPYDFEVFVDPHGLKSQWEYSSMFNKIYIDMKQKFPINFSVKIRNTNGQMFIRAMPMYEEDRYYQDIVRRCISHEQPQDTSNIGLSPEILQHVIRCDNEYAVYHGSRDAGRRLSIVFPLLNPQTGSDSVKEFFQFMCKSSCPSGMNRRPIQVIFTLEDNFGNVLGRRVLCVRICSCPKRDREKDENKNDKHAPEHGKKRKLDKKVAPPADALDTKVFSLNNVKVVGEANYKAVLKYCHDLMAGTIVTLDGKNDVPFRKCLGDIKSQMNKLNQ